MPRKSRIPGGTASPRAIEIAEAIEREVDLTARVRQAVRVPTR